MTRKKSLPRIAQAEKERKLQDMHMRTKKWARPELAACPFYEPEGEQRKGHWREAFSHPDHPLQLEMGCGKGVSTAKMAAANPDINSVRGHLPD